MSLTSIHTIGDALYRYRDSPKLAVICEGRELTYGQLWDAGTRIARHLIELGVKKGDRVILDVERSEHYVCLLLGLSLAGGVAVYIHRGWPEEQRAYVIEDCAPKLVVDDEMALRLEEAVPDAPGAASRTSLPSVSGEDAFQIVYTSGSTGRPKGAVLCHAVAANISLPFADNRLCQYEEEHDDRLLIDLDFSFVGMCILLMRALFNEKTAVIASERETSSMGRLATLVANARATEVIWTPSRIRSLLANPDMAREVNRLERMSVVGEKVPEWLYPLVQRYMPSTRVFCAYGMAELMQVEEHLFLPGEESLLEGGVHNITLHVLDEKGAAVPVGGTGEICVSGTPAWYGSYWNNPELTNQKYVQHPSLGRIFRTGDLATLEESGRMRIKGRGDTTAKLRGMRIDLQAIEGTMLAYPGVREVVVQIQGSERQVLAAFYTRDDAGGEADDFALGLRRRLAAELPYYMVPEQLMEVAAIPLNYNGKTDHRALERLVPQGAARRAAQTDTERLLCGLFAEVLHLTDTPSANDSFFALGGDSMAGIELASRLADLGVRMEMRWLYAAPTPALLSQMVSQEESDNPPGLHLSLPELPAWSEAQRRAIEWTGIAGEVECLYPVYEGTERRLRDRDFWTLADFWLIDFDEQTPTRIRTRLGQMARAHQALRSVFLFPEGEQPVQAVLKDREPEFFYEDLSGSAQKAGGLSAEQRRYLGRRLRYDYAVGFDDARGPLWKVGLVRIAKNRAVVYRFYSHTLLDGQSMVRFMDDLRGSDELRPDARLMNAHVRKALFAPRSDAEGYFRGLGLPMRLASVPTPSPGRASGGGGLRSVRVQREGLVEKVQGYCASAGVTLATALHYCLGRALCALVGQATCCFLSVSGGRGRDESGLLGSFVYEFPFVFNEGDSIWSCQEKLLRADMHAWVWSLSQMAPLRLADANTVVLDILNVYGTTDDKNLSLLSPYAALDDIGTKTFIQQTHRSTSGPRRLFVTSATALGQLLTAVYDPSTQDQTFVEALFDQLSKEVHDMLGS